MVICSNIFTKNNIGATNTCAGGTGPGVGRNIPDWVEGWYGAGGTYPLAYEELNAS